MIQKLARSTRFVFLVIILSFGFIQTAAEAGCTDCRQVSETKSSNLQRTPQIWSEALPAFIKKSPADHTYLKAMRENGFCQAWPCFGRDSGGKKLVDTQSNIAEEAVPVIGKLSDASPCKWPNHYYLVIGVCHQLANRGLYYTGKTVHNARLYKWTSHIYGIYGACFWPLKKYCLFNCLESAGRWPLPKDPKARKAIETSPVYPEAAIYRKHFPATKPAMNLGDYKAAHQKYIDELLKFHITDRLGERYLQEKFEGLKNLRDMTLARKEKLDEQMLQIGEQKLQEDEKLMEAMIGKYNYLFNSMLSQYQHRDFLTPKEYFNFFGLKVGEAIDMRWFLPKNY